MAASGVLLNVNVVLLNQGMPIGVAATPAAIAGIAAGGGFYHVAGLTTVAAWAGDVLPLRTMGHTYYLSPGDVLLGVGVAVLIADAMIAAAPLLVRNGRGAG